MLRRILIFFVGLLLISISSYSQNQPEEYYITCNPEDFAYIYAHYEEDIYIPITLTCDGVTWTETEMRIRGDGSRQFPKKSLKVRFNDIPFANGRYELNFNAEWEDPTYMRAFISSLIFRMAGQTCFNAEHARLYLNGAFLGLYVYIENVDEQFLEANGYDPDGNLYKAAVDGACLSIYDDLAGYWEQKTGGGNKEDLAEFIDQINQVPDDEYLDFCEEQMNYDQMVNIIACNMILSNQSTYYHNYYMYHDVNRSGKWEMMPWDLDKTLSVYAWKNYTNSSAPWVPDNPYLERALLDETIFADIKDRVTDIGEELFIQEVLFPVIDSLFSVLQLSIGQDTTDNVATTADWLNQVNVEKNYILNWPVQIQSQFDHLQSTFVADRTPGVFGPNVAFHWTPSVDPDGGMVTYRFSITTGTQFEPELTRHYESITSTVFILNDLEEGDYFWKVTSIKGQQEVEAFDSRNPLIVRNFITLPCNITESTTLTIQNSPYLVDCDVVVGPDAVLTINEGVSLMFMNHTYLKITGGLEVLGTRDTPVTFKPFQSNSYFDSIVFIDPVYDIHLNYLNITDAVVHAENANVTFNHCSLTLLNKHVTGQNVIYGHYHGSVVFNGVKVNGNNTGQGLEFAWCEPSIVENCSFSNIDDPVEFISVNSGYVKSNKIQFSNDDGIDFNNCKNLTISNNIIYNCNDNGISIGNEFNGPCENILIEKNLVVNCYTGVTIKDGGNATLIGNTFYHNGINFKLFQKNAGLGGGHAIVKNTIIAAVEDIVIDIDPLSDIEITYSLCDTEALEGTGNLFDDPGFVSVADSVFLLAAGSPCINAGDPATNPDPDGTRADIGVFYYNLGNYPIVFNEINYKSETGFDTEDWVELYNIGETNADISGWVFRDDSDNHIFEIPYGTIIPPGGYLLLCADLMLFKSLYPDFENAIGSFPFGLSSNGDEVRLFSHTGILIDSVAFDDEYPWPTEPDGQGPTLELKNPFLDNGLAENWCASANHGTPGDLNSCFQSAVSEYNSPEISLSVYPNPTNGVFNIQIQSVEYNKADLLIYDSFGKKMKETRNIPVQDGITLFETVQHFPAGIYLVRLNFFSSGRSGRYSFKILIY